MKNKYLKYFIFGFILALFISQKGFAQLDVVKGSFIYPSIMETGEYKHELSLLLAKLPEDQIESTSAWIYAPLFTYHAKYGLPYSFNLKGSASSNIITYHFRAGLQWSYNIKRVTFSINSDAAYWFGRLNSFGFDSGVNAWNGYSNFTMGIEFDKFTLTIQTETNYVISIKQTADDIETENKNSFLAGGSVAIFIEQPVWKDNYMTLGVRSTYSKLYWPSWAVFPSWDRYHVIPEIFIGFVL